MYGENLKNALGEARGDGDAMISAKESETALGPPLVTVDVDPDADQNNPEHVGRMVLGISANDRPGIVARHLAGVESLACAVVTLRSFGGGFAIGFYLALASVAKHHDERGDHDGDQNFTRTRDWD